MLLAPIFFAPFVLTVINIVYLITRPEYKGNALFVKFIEAVTIVLGAILIPPYLAIKDVKNVPWYEAIMSNEKHAPISHEHSAVLIVIVALSLVSYVCLRYIGIGKLPPLSAVIMMSSLALGIAVFVVFGMQLGSLIMIPLYAFNCVLIYLRVFRDVVIAYAQSEKSTSLSWLDRSLNKAVSLPIFALLLALPLLLLICVALMLFGQEPDAIIKAWTETADWTFSQKIPPPSIPYEGHYLCTVAATGHRSIVKPLRTGVRHGHTVVVNRQLCIANAFEDLIKQRTPRLHRVIRNTYDAVGLPIAKKVKSPYVCDLIYIIMKPLEWLFLLILYLFDVKPENRIALQYPHKKLINK